jgi:hypothetical protein
VVHRSLLPNGTHPILTQLFEKPDDLEAEIGVADALTLLLNSGGTDSETNLLLRGEFT